MKFRKYHSILSCPITAVLSGYAGLRSQNSKGFFLLVLVWVSFLHSDCGLDAPGLVTPFGFFLDILPWSTICSHCANILSQFMAPCDALRTWPLCFPTCWSHFINYVLFLRISAPDLDLSLPRDWFGRVCQVPAALHNLFLPFPTNQRVRLRSPRHAVWRHPSP